MTYNVSSGTLNPTHSLTIGLVIVVIIFSSLTRVQFRSLIFWLAQCSILTPIYNAEDIFRR